MPHMKSTRLWLGFLLLVLTDFAFGSDPTGPDQGEMLYNGIQLPALWPPAVDTLTRQPMDLPYMRSLPQSLPIDIGRQLFVDDFLIEQSTASRTFHQAKYHPASPVLRPDQPWETNTVSKGYPAPTAMVFSDGVWYDPHDRLFKMWYMGGYVQSTCYAVSQDGINWVKPLLDVKPSTNCVLDKPRDSATIWLDHEAADSSQRYKLFLIHRGEQDYSGLLYVSADGIHWADPPAQAKMHDDRTTLFYNPFRKKWVYSIRCNYTGMGRSRRYRENDDVFAGLAMDKSQETLWVGADWNDRPRPDLPAAPELYNLDAVAYESLMLGLFSIWPGQPVDRAKPNYVCLGFSRDGFHWHRPDHRPFLNVSEQYGDWNWGNVQSAGGGCLIGGDELYFYVSGRSGVKGSSASGVCATGLAVLRRDGFASMDAGKKECTLTTRPVRFSGNHLFVNSDSRKGRLQVEVLDVNDRVLAPYTKHNCVAVKTDETLQRVTWKGASDLSPLKGQTVKFRFYLRQSRLYAFWVSRETSGASDGYVAAGGPGFTGPTDTVGSAVFPDKR